MSSQACPPTAFNEPPITIHHIKSLTPTFNDSFFFPSQHSIFFIQKSLCQQTHKTKTLTISNQECELIDCKNKPNKIQTQDKNSKPNKIQTVDKQSVNNPNIISQEDLTRLLSQVVQKGKKVQNFVKTLIGNSCMTTIKHQLENYVQQNIFLISAAQLIVSDYYKKRKLGQKLRGLNQDLLNQIQTKLFPLLKTQFTLWHSQNQNKRIQTDFTRLTQQFSQNLHSLCQTQTN